ncbi:double-stranded RNA-binding protein Staufen homolog isoform X2 [Physella acuta]|nr:double-stranded RNA-binding protein Staufen homolog isoform X2 [Physella acuta]
MSSKQAYQLQPTQNIQLTHLQQQQLVNNYHGQKQISTDIASAHQFTPALGNMPAQNGTTYQSISGSSIHSSHGMDNNALSLQHQSSHHQYQQPQQQSIQTPVQHFQPTQLSQPQQPHHIHQTVPQHHHLLPQQQQIQIQQQPIAQHQSSNYQQQQHIQIQQHLQQRSLHQQRYHKQQQSQQIQPKQILQHPSKSNLNHVTTPSTIQVQQGTKPAVINNTPSIAENKNVNDKVEVKLSNEESEQSKNNAAETLGLANTKEKTPMCLINELARFNKMSHQYTLVDEQGPAHKKTFYVKLKLGDEEYSASGESIKKAQHAAAAIALVETKHQHPPPKPTRYSSSNSVDSGDENITPTVELNALAMKRGEAAIYKAIEPQQPSYYPQPGMDYRGIYNYNQRYQQYMRANRDPRYRGSGVLWPLRYHYPRMSRAFYVSLRVGHREFIGDGPTRQAARHNAAQKALRILKNLPVQIEAKKDQEPAEEETNDSLKSEISLVHEIALRRNMPVNFEVIREAGPPHMKNFITRCIVGEKVTEGEGNSKKTSKKKAAELMLEELRKLPPTPTPVYPRPKSKIQINKKKNRNLIKSELQQQKADPNYGVGINPISRLIQIMQAQKKKEPVYTLIAERGLPRRREFIMQVEVEDKNCTGTGPNKKLAKRSAAEAMLQLLGYTKPSPQPVKSSFKHPASGEGNQSNGDKKVTFVEGDIPTSDVVEKAPTPVQPTQQRVPGLLHLPNSTSKLATTSAASATTALAQPKESLVNLASILKPNLRPEIQLKELCKALGHEIEIDDFTKKKPTGTEHITRIIIGKEQSQSFHGSSNTLESSRDMAALDALKVLLAKVKDIHPGGDGPQLKKELLTRSSSGMKKDISK